MKWRSAVVTVENAQLLMEFSQEARTGHTLAWRGGAAPFKGHMFSRVKIFKMKCVADAFSKRTQPFRFGEETHPWPNAHALAWSCDITQEETKESSPKCLKKSIFKAGSPVVQFAGTYPPLEVNGRSLKHSNQR